MSYTLLELTDRGVVLWDYHVRRLGLAPGSAAFEALAGFARDAEPGVWAVWADPAAGIRVERRPGSRLADGLPVRTLPSPLAGRAGPLAKPCPPGPFAPVRLPGVATLLTSADGSEILEACSAAVLGWDGSCLVRSPSGRPRVWSTAEAALCDHLSVREAPLTPGALPLLLVNAVKRTCTLASPWSDGFPARVRADLDRLLVGLTKRPGR